MSASAVAPVGDRNLATGTRLWAGAEAFMFLAFLFAFFYLRTIDSNGAWHPAGQSPSQAMGTATLIVLVIGALAYLGGRRTRSAAAPAVLLALVAGVVAIVLQCYQLFAPGFSPSHAGGYGSVFIGFTAMYVLQLVGVTFWLETVVARARRSAAPTGADDAMMTASAAERYSSFGVLWYATVLFYIIAYVMFYLV